MLNMCKNNETDCCKTCAFWKEYQWHGMASVSEELVTGECHRNPPSTDGHRNFFPTTKSTEWCGEHKAEKYNKENR